MVDMDMVAMDMVDMDMVDMDMVDMDIVGSSDHHMVNVSFMDFSSFFALVCGSV